MILYNVTISIDQSCEDEWLDWMRSIHIPDVIKTGFFKECKICRLIDGEEKGGKTYAVMYSAYTEEGSQRLQIKSLRSLAKGTQRQISREICCI